MKYLEKRAVLKLAGYEVDYAGRSSQGCAWYWCNSGDDTYADRQVYLSENNAWAAAWIDFMLKAERK
jgi:hypothetical protein